MKYIRTKDELVDVSNMQEYEADDENDNRVFDGYGSDDFLIYYPVEDIVKQADTIEELCDEFRGVWINYYESEKKDAHEEYHYDKEKNVFYDDFEELTPKEAIEKFDIFYGAIWTDNGLIYKAKMKGVLPNGEIDWELL